MDHKQIRDEYEAAITEFAQKMRDIDDKYGTYQKCNVVNVPILQVGDGNVRYRRTIEVGEILLNFS